MSGTTTTNRFIEFTCRLQVTNPIPGDQYELLIFASSPPIRPTSTTSSPYEQLVPIEHDSRTAAPVQLPLEHHPTLLHMWLFVTTTHKQLRIPRTLLLGWGYGSFDSIVDSRSNTTIKLVDVTKGPQAQLTIRMKDGTGVQPRPFDSRDQVRVPSCESIRLGMQQLYTYTHSDIQQCYQKLVRAGFKPPSPDRSHFYYVETHMQEKLPISTFAYLSSLVQQNSDTVPLLRSLYQQAVREIESVRAKNTGSYNTTRLLGEQLVAMCTMLPRALHYTDDVRRLDRKGRTESVDQWTQLGMFPRLATTGFDCEDGAALVLSVLYLLRHVKLPSSDVGLIELQQHALRYTPFFTLGNMRVGTGSSLETDYVSHAYVIMIDKRWVEKKINPTTSSSSFELYLPSLSLESTASISGVWDDDSSLAKSQIAASFEDVHRALERACQHIPDIHQSMRPFTPISTVNARQAPVPSRHKGSYEDIYVLMAVDHQSDDQPDRVLHLIVSQKSATPTIGALAELVLSRSERVQLNVVVDLTRTKFEETYQTLWKQQPKNILPKSSGNKTTTATTLADSVPLVGIVDIPSLVYRANQHAIQDALMNRRFPYQCTFLNEVTVADGIGFIRVHLTMNRYQ